ncbi:MAG: type II toxin-antitoxin system RelE family toxin [Terriglobales bacterium]
MPYTVLFEAAALRALDKIRPENRARIIARAEALAHDPFPPGYKKLRGPEGYFRIRVGDYRIVYDVQHNRLVILVIRVGHRREVYR